MAQRAPAPASYEEILALPRHRVGQIVRGVLHTHARPAPRHAAAATALSEELGPPFKRGRGGPGGWWLLIEPELHLGADVLVPDLAGWRRDRMPEMPVDLPYFILSPDWLCEVLARSTAALDRGDKLDAYAREGVGLVWFVDPEAQTLEVLRLDGATYRIVQHGSGASAVRAEPFDAIEIDLALLWSR